MKTAFRAAGLLASLLLFPLGTRGESLPAKADSDKVVQLEEFSVTGTHLKRTDQEQVLPVTVLGRDQIESRDASSPADLLTMLPAVTGLSLNETATLGAQARGDDAAISLRGLPSADTLILLNGRRLAPQVFRQ